MCLVAIVSCLTKRSSGENDFVLAHSLRAHSEGIVYHVGDTTAAGSEAGYTVQSQETEAHECCCSSVPSLLTTAVGMVPLVYSGASQLSQYRQPLTDVPRDSFLW